MVAMQWTGLTEEREGLEVSGAQATGQVSNRINKAVFIACGVASKTIK